MGIETQAILPGHLTAEAICELLVAGCGVGRTAVRAMHRADYKIIEFADAAGSLQALNVFLNSYAAQDYADVFDAESTLATMEFSPSNYDVLTALAGAVGGYVQRVNGEPWLRVPAGVA